MNGSWFPIRVRYLGDSKDTIVNSPAEIVRGKGFKILETRVNLNPVLN